MLFFGVSYLFIPTYDSCVVICREDAIQIAIELLCIIGRARIVGRFAYFKHFLRFILLRIFSRKNAKVFLKKLVSPNKINCFQYFSSIFCNATIFHWILGKKIIFIFSISSFFDFFQNIFSFFQTFFKA